ncbi:unnamed protein product [Pedinophyceae sp. YPF-701]|nr:unnamed protein product [Pedinophyceae sp. YPF-701]
MGDGQSSSQAKTRDLQPRTELRIEASWDQTATVTLREGTAEVFGTELRLQEKVRVSGTSIAIFTWTGAKVDVQAEGALVYTSDETTVPQHLALHDTLEARRIAARTDSSAGPRVLVVGNMDAGKSTLIRTLASWGVRTGWHPTVVDLDIGQGAVGVPGSIGAVTLEEPVDIEEGAPSEPPLAFYFGHVTPSDNMPVYKALVEQLAGVLERRDSADPLAKASGWLINTMGWTDGEGYDLLLQAAEAMKCDVVVVIGQDRLHARLQSDLSANQKKKNTPLGVEVVRVPRSGGVVDRTPESRKEARRRRLRAYFYGRNGELKPHTQTLPASDLQVYRIGGGFVAPAAALPIGTSAESGPGRLSRAEPGRGLPVGTVLAVSHASKAEDIPRSNVAGFVHLQRIEQRDGQTHVQYLAPRPGLLPGEFLLAGHFQVLDLE